MAKITVETVTTTTYNLTLNEREYEALRALSSAMQEHGTAFRGENVDAWDVIADLIGGSHANALKYIMEVE